MESPRPKKIYRLQVEGGPLYLISPEAQETLARIFDAGMERLAAAIDAEGAVLAAAPPPVPDAPEEP